MRAEEPEADRRGALRIPLRWLLVPVALSAGASMVADWTWPALVNSHPLLLIALSQKNRFLLLTAPQLDIVSFFVVGFLRLVVTDPVTYLIGRQYGESALSWLENKTSRAPEGQSMVRKAERLFGRAAPLMIVVAPSHIWCVLAGASRMKVWLFATCNVVGTIGRLTLFWIAADTFREPLETVLDAVESAQVWLLGCTLLLGITHTVLSRRRRRRLAGAGGL